MPVKERSMATRRKKARSKPKPARKKRPAPKGRRKAPARRPGAAARTGGGAPRTLPTLAVETTAGPLPLSELKGRNVILYFYPKDDTPGCTAEGCDIRDRFADFGRRDAVVLGVSRDSIPAHERFRDKYRFPFELVSDPDGKLCRLFGVMKRKTLYGRSYLGIERSTFVYDRSGALRKEIRGVKVAGHADELLRELDLL
jgi:peroxiredoxin Q/BCP